MSEWLLVIVYSIIDQCDVYTNCVFDLSDQTYSLKADCSTRKIQKFIIRLKYSPIIDFLKIDSIDVEMILVQIFLLYVMHANEKQKLH
jgi:hypothetical protein